MGNLEIENHTNTHIIVRGDHGTYNNIMKEMRGRWYKSIKGSGGWSIPIEYKAKIQSLTDLNNIKESCKDKNTQRKYKSSHSDNEDESEDSDNEQKQNIESIQNFYEKYQKSPERLDTESDSEKEIENENEIENEIEQKITS